MARKPITIRDERGRAIVLETIKALDIGKQWDVTIVPHRKKRSLDQNALYWKWVGIVAEETGNTTSDIHEWAKGEFLPPVFVEIGGRSREIRQSTTDLNVTEMSRYMSQFQAWATRELGLILPVPEDLGRDAA